MLVTSLILLFYNSGAPPAIDSGEAKNRTASCENVDKLMPNNTKFRGGGGTHIFGRTGMCRPNGSLFLQEIFKHGSRFLPKKSLDMGQLF